LLIIFFYSFVYRLFVIFLPAFFSVRCSDAFICQLYSISVHSLKFIMAARILAATSVCSDCVSAHFSNCRCNFTL